MKNQKIIELRFLLTPIATTKWLVKNVERKRIYLFGFKVADFAL